MDGFSSMTAPIASGWSNIAGWDSHPLENAALARRTPTLALPERDANGECAAKTRHSQKKYSFKAGFLQGVKRPHRSVARSPVEWLPCRYKHSGRHDPANSNWRERKYREPRKQTGAVQRENDGIEHIEHFPGHAEPRNLCCRRDGVR